MNEKTRQGTTAGSPRLWPWLAGAILVVPMALLLKMGENDSQPTVVAVPVSQSAVVNTPLPTTSVIPEESIETPTPDGIVDPVPAVSNLPVASGEVPNHQKVHAGDDSAFLKDEDSKEEKDEEKEGA